MCDLCPVAGMRSRLYNSWGWVGSSVVGLACSCPAPTPPRERGGRPVTSGKCPRGPSIPIASCLLLIARTLAITQKQEETKQTEVVREIMPRVVEGEDGIGWKERRWSHCCLCRVFLSVCFEVVVGVSSGLELRQMHPFGSCRVSPKVGLCSRRNTTLESVCQPHARSVGHVGWAKAHCYRRNLPVSASR